LTALKLWLSLLLLGLAAYGGWTFWRIYAAKPPDNHSETVLNRLNLPVGEFVLTERSGRLFNSQELLGQIWVVSFFYADCPTACPMMNHRIGDLMTRELAEEPVTFVSISVEPRKDSPRRLASYAETYTKPRKIEPQRWLFLTQADGNEELLGAICQSSFGLMYGKAAHSEKLVLVDQQGTVRGYYDVSDDIDIKRLKKKIDELRRNPPAAKDTPNKDTPNKDTPNKDTPNKDAPNKDAPNKDAAAKDAAVKDADNDAAAKGRDLRDAAAKGAA
jgi:protein SCO1/2